MRRKFGEFISVESIKHLLYIPIIVLKLKNWHEFLATYIGFNNNANIFTFRDGTKIKTYEGVDSSTLMVVMLRKDYGEAKSNATIIDIGANIGTYSIHAALAPHTKVYAYEPLAETFSKLEENIRLNKLGKKIKAFKLGVAARRGKRKLYLSSNSPFHSMHAKSKNYVNIENITLKDVFEHNKIKRCDILKMDCEGAEYEILYNVSKKYLKRIKELRLEYHYLNKKNNIERLTEFLENNGFRRTKINRDAHDSGIAWFRRKLN